MQNQFPYYRAGLSEYAKPTTVAANVAAVAVGDDGTRGDKCELSHQFGIEILLK
jgi:hypothetical protein